MLNIRIAIALLVTLAPAVSSGASDGADRAWNFDVYIDDKKVGYHTFELSQQKHTSELKSEARFNVNFLFVTLYKYAHDNSETWTDGCLTEIESSTNANGERIAIQGKQQANQFSLRTGDGTNENVEVGASMFDGCLRSFAYWDPNVLASPALLNPQTGEVLPVKFERQADEVINVRDNDIQATRYRLQTEELDIDVWYSQDDEWLALKSTTKEGRIIRYELT